MPFTLCPSQQINGIPTVILGPGVTLVLEWVEEMIKLLPSDLTLSLTGEGGSSPQDVPLASAQRMNGLVQVRLPDIHAGAKMTLTAKTGSTELVLFQDQVVSAYDQPFEWQHALEELLPPPPADDAGDASGGEGGDDGADGGASGNGAPASSPDAGSGTTGA